MKRIFLCAAGALTLFCMTSCYRGSVPTGIGLPAPNFAIRDDEKTISLAHFRGQVVVLNFWASWCRPCISETPSLVSMQERLRNKGVVVVGVSLDEDEDMYHRFIRQYGVNFVTVREPNARTEHLYGTMEIPETYIIDRNGILRRRLINSVNWSTPEIVEFLSTL